MMHFAHMYEAGEGHYQMWGSSGPSMFLWVLLWSILVAFLVYGVVRLIQANTGSKGETSAVEIVRTRYAKGEITKKEYKDLIEGLKE